MAGKCSWRTGSLADKPTDRATGTRCELQLGFTEGDEQTSPWHVIPDLVGASWPYSDALLASRVGVGYSTVPLMSTG